MNSPLEKTFDLPSDEDVADVENYIKVNIPKNATLADIVTLSLEAYKIQMELIGKIEPRYRGRAFEVAHAYLENALEAIARDKELQLRETKQNHDMKKKDAKDGDDDEDASVKISREQLLEVITGQKRAH